MVPRPLPKACFSGVLVKSPGMVRWAKVWARGPVYVCLTLQSVMEGEDTSEYINRSRGQDDIIN